MLVLRDAEEQVAQGHLKASPGGHGCNRQGTYENLYKDSTYVRRDEERPANGTILQR